MPQAVRNTYAALTADQQSQVQEFPLTLGRQEDVDAAATPVDLTGFIIEQEQVVGTRTWSSPSRRRTAR